MKILLPILLLALIPHTLHAGGPFRRVQRIQEFHRPHQVQQVKRQHVIVNNLVGIPVPVTYQQPYQQYYSSQNLQSYSQLQTPPDMGVLYSQAARLAEQAQQLGARATEDFARSTILEGQHQAEVARILAQGQAASQALQAVRVEETRSVDFSFIQEQRQTIEKPIRSLIRE